MRTPQRTIPSASTTAMLRILRRQSRQCPFVDFVRAECLLVLLQLETVYPGAVCTRSSPLWTHLRQFTIPRFISTGEPRDHRDRPAQIVLGDPVPEMPEAAARARRIWISN